MADVSAETEAAIGFLESRVNSLNTTAIYHAYFSLDQDQRVKLEAAASSLESETASIETTVRRGWEKSGKLVPSVVADFAAGAYLVGEGAATVANSISYVISNSSNDTRQFWNNGNITSTNSLRVETNPTTGDVEGLLLEGSSENLVPYSRPSEGTWNTIRTTLADESAGSWKGYNSTVSKITPSTDNASHIILLPAMAINANSTYTLSFWLLDSSAWSAGAVYNSDGTDEIASSPVFEPGSAGHLTNDGWTQYVHTFDTPSDSTSLELRIYLYDPATGKINFAGDGTSASFIEAVQLEEKPYVTSYISSRGSATTRSPDGTVGLSDYAMSKFNMQDFTIYMRAVQKSTTGSFFYISGALNSLRVGAPTNNSTALNGTRLNLAQFYPSVVKGEEVRFACSVSGNITKLQMNDDFAQSSADGSPMGTRTFRLGTLAGSNNAMDGYIRELRIYPFSMSEDQLRSLTT